MTYDPATNSYITESGDEVTTTNSETTDTEENDEEDAPISSIWPSSSSSETQDSDDDQETDQDTDADDNLEEETTPTFEPGNWDWSLEYIHTLLDANAKALSASLKSSYNALQQEMDDLYGDDEQNRLATLQCLNIIDDELIFLIK